MAQEAPERGRARGTRAHGRLEMTMRKPGRGKERSRAASGAQHSTGLVVGIPFYADPLKVRAGVGSYSSEFVAQVINSCAADEVRLFVDGGLFLISKATPSRRCQPEHAAK